MRVSERKGVRRDGPGDSGQPARRRRQWHEDPRFLALRRAAYRRLAASGFVDLEYTDWHDGSAGDVLPGMTLVDARRHWTPEAQRWAELARQYVWTLDGGRGAGSQRRADEARVWRRRADGMSDERIAADLGGAWTPKRVSRIRQRVEARFKKWVARETRQRQVDDAAYLASLQTVVVKPQP